jgi:hypothetical protein
MNDKKYHVITKGFWQEDYIDEVMFVTEFMENG